MKDLTSNVPKIKLLYVTPEMGAQQHFQVFFLHIYNIYYNIYYNILLIFQYIILYFIYNFFIISIYQR